MAARSFLIPTWPGWTAEPNVLDELGLKCINGLSNDQGLRAEGLGNDAIRPVQPAKKCAWGHHRLHSALAELPRRNPRSSAWSAGVSQISHHTFDDACIKHAALAGIEFWHLNHRFDLICSGLKFSIRDNANIFLDFLR
jgi:hypothetical protein